MDEGILFWLVIGAISIFSILIILVPVAGLTARFALKPMMEAIAKYRDMSGQTQALELLERRVALIEEQINGIERSIKPVLEEAEFRQRLESPPLETSPDER